MSCNPSDTRGGCTPKMRHEVDDCRRPIGGTKTIGVPQTPTFPVSNPDAPFCSDFFQDETGTVIIDDDLEKVDLGCN